MHTLELGPAFGYYSNAMKTWLIVKEHHLDKANDQFNDSGISITTEGKRHLGAAIGTPQFISDGPIRRCTKPGSLQARTAKWAFCTKTRITFLGSPFP